ncbi:MAG: hypothetical protein PHQ40_02150 [Anaerolineaceae bacterium]|nr:hypothetical protein [Anaerolineaceae bacterium]
MQSPKLIIRRVVVDGKLAYDQRFYPGLNVIQSVQTGNDIRSTNGCGKTSLVELIQHGFGKKHDSKAKFFFASIIDQIDTLWLEFEVDSGVFTIQRSLVDIFSAAHLYEGPYVPGMEKTPSEMISIEDMSPLLLKLTGIPEVSVKTRTGETTPLSFRLLMRAFILHQENSFAEILFKVEPETRKSDIIGFLTGITPLDRFPLEERIGEITRREQLLENFVTNVTKFLDENGVPSLIDANAHVEEARTNLATARAEQRAIQQLMVQGQNSDRRGQTDALRQKLLSIKQEISEIEQSYLGNQQEANRLKELNSSLRSDKQKSLLLQASTTKLSHVDFDICPRCLQEISIEMRFREKAGRCLLCNRPLITTSDSLPRRILKTDDVDVQIEETNQILDSLQRDLNGYQNRLMQLKENERAIGRELEVQVSAFVSPAVDQLIAQADMVSERQAELAKAIHLLEQGLSIEKQREELDKLKSQLAELTDELEEVSKAKRQLREALRRMYSDVLRAVGFPKVREVSIDPQTLLPLINGNLYIAQGTAFKGLATVCFHLALLNFARMQQTYFPKMLVIDSPNVGDLNEDNHTKLLNYIGQLSSTEDSTDQDWQIILTTRYLPPSLEPYVRDTISNPDKMLLRKHNRLVSSSR